mgnify:CR=1 FL=1
MKEYEVTYKLMYMDFEASYKDYDKALVAFVEAIKAGKGAVRLLNLVTHDFAEWDNGLYGNSGTTSLVKSMLKGATLQEAYLKGLNIGLTEASSTIAYRE